MSGTEVQKPTVFISYSRKDEIWKNKLEAQLDVLRTQGLLDVWSDREIGAGTDWRAEIDAAIDRAAVAVLLVSADSLTSDVILEKEVKPLLERRRREGLTFFPIIVRPCPWQKVEWLEQMQCRPRDRPLSSQQDAQAEATLAEIAGDIAEMIEKTTERRVTSLSRGTIATAAQRISDEAIAIYERGRYHWKMRHEGGLQKGMRDFAEAIERAPDYAEPYAGLADSYLMLGWMLLMAPDRVFPAAREYAQEALKRDHDLAEAHLAKAFVDFYYYRKWDEADEGFEHALDLKPSYAIGRWWYAYYLMVVGRRDEGLEQANLAVKTAPDSLPVRAGLAQILFFAQDYDGAVRQCEDMLAKTDFGLAHLHLGWAYEQQGKYPEALAELRLAEARIPSPSAVLIVAHARAKQGDLEGALSDLDKVDAFPAEDYASPCQTAAVYVALGDTDRALEYLKRGFEERDGSLWWITVDPRFAPLKRLAGFKELTANLGLEPEMDDQYAGSQVPDRPSFAVLPFDNLSGNPAQEYLSWGLTDTLTTELRRIPSLFVIAHNSAYQYADRAIDARAVGLDLGVAYLLQGGIQRIGDRVRINVHLVDAATKRCRWAKKYDGAIQDLFTLQDDIANDVAFDLIKLRPEERQRLARAPTADPRAYESFSRGRMAWFRFEERSNREAQDLFGQAVALDPQFAAAYAWLGWTYFIPCYYQWSDDPQNLEEAFEKAQRALQLDATLSEPYQVLASVYLVRDRNYELAVEFARKALDLDGNYADAYIVLAEILNFSGRPAEAVELAKQAIRLDPHYPIYLNTLALSHALMGNHRTAIHFLTRALRDVPDNPRMVLTATYCYNELGRDDQARSCVAEALGAEPGLSLEAVSEMYPFADQAVRTRFLGALGRSGLG